MLVWLKQAKIDIWKSSPQTYISFYKVFFEKKHSKAPQANICDRDSLRPPRHSFFFLILPPFKNLRLKVLPSPQQKRGLILCQHISNPRFTDYWTWSFSSFSWLMIKRRILTELIIRFNNVLHKCQQRKLETRCYSFLLKILSVSLKLVQILLISLK